jgi:hypothetical protein
MNSRRLIVSPPAEPSRALSYHLYAARTGRFIVRDANGQVLAYVYCEDELGRRAAAKLLTGDEARRIAANIAKLPGLLRRSPPIKRGVTRLQPHISRQSARCPLSPQFRKYRRNALSDVMGQDRTHAPRQADQLFDHLVGRDE